jgi:hypothetical protein
MKVTIKKQMARKGKASMAYKKSHKKKGPQQKFALKKAKPSTIKNVGYLAETKKFQGFVLYPEPKPIGIQESFISTSASATFIPLHAFWFMRARNDIPELLSSVEGREIFSKYLQLKMEIKYPSTHFGPEGGTRPLECIYGFTTPINLTSQTVPLDTQVTEVQFFEHVTDLVSGDFDSKNDTMEFKDKRRRAYNVTGRFKIKPNNNGLIPSPWRSDQAPGQIGTTIGDRDIPPLRRNVNFTMNKKIRYRRSNQGQPTDPLEPILYPNQAYIPFVLLYNPDYANYKNNTTDPEGNEEIRQITLRTNSCHWFSDF